MARSNKKPTLKVPFLDDEGGIEITIRGQRWTITRAKERLIDSDGEWTCSMIVDDGDIRIDPDTPAHWLPAIIAQVVAMAANDGDDAAPTAGAEATATNEEPHEALTPAENRLYAKDFESIARKLMDAA